MTKKEIKEFEELTEKCIKIIESKLNVTYWCYDNEFKIYRFKIKDNFETLTLDLSRSLMIALSENVC